MKKQQSLRELAREIGVSHAYLSQVMHGKRPVSEKVRQALSGKQVVSKPGGTLTIGDSSPRGDSNPPTYRLQVGCAAIAPLGQR